VARKEMLWPALDAGYQEEFGPVDPEVHRVASDLWPSAEHFALDVLHDAGAGFRLLKRAVVAVSTLPADRREQIHDLPAYLFRTYKRLVLAELEKLNGHRKHDLETREALHPLSIDAAEIERQILVAEVVHHLDPWAREVFENLTLGYSFEEIGRVLEANPQVIRNRFRLALRRLAASINRDSESATARTTRLRRNISESIKRLRMMRVRRLNPSR